MNKSDVLIIGGGIAGLTLACALARQSDLTINVLESQAAKTNIDARSAYQPRVSAVSLASVRIMQSLGAWSGVKACRVNPFKEMYVWDDAQKADIHFSAQEIASPCLGYIIENQVMHQALLEKAEQHYNVKIFYHEQLEQLNDDLSCQTSSGKAFAARFIAGADGAHSSLRQLAGIKVDIKDYEQLAIVSNVQTELPHKAIAQQVFLAAGPLAFLPLNQDKLSSIVWSMARQQAEEMLSLDEEVFKQTLAQAFDHRLGKIEAISKRYAFPLKKLVADKYVKPGIALLGDAAHVVHPLAGQGVNMGFLDAASLAEVILEAHHQGRDFASLATLRRYERWRKADNQGLLFGVDWLKELFAKQQGSAQHIRGLGLKLTGQVSPIKQLFISHAVGNRSMLPGLAAEY